MQIKEGSLVRKRYALRRLIGQGAVASTWVAADRQSGRDVVVKLLSFSLVEDWKAFELFEREAAVLKGLSHDGIPAYVDSFRWGEGESSRFVLVQELVDGTSLQARVDAGWRATEEEIRRIAVRLLGILQYIHSLRPPLIHRDINPHNVLLADDGRVFLVDFGGVQDAVRAAPGSTVVGTPGFMPMEQFVGRATVRSDLYGCAATILFLLTHRNPQDLPTVDMKIDVGAVTEVSPGLGAVLDSWLEPDEQRRLMPVDEALRCLESGEAPRTGPGTPDLRPPHGSRITVTRSGREITITVPERGTGKGSFAFGGFSVFWIGFVALWTFGTVVMKAWPMSLFSIPFWLAGVFLVRSALRRRFGSTILRFDPHGGLSLARRFIRGSTLVSPFREVGELTVPDTGPVSLELGARTILFAGELTQVEKKWLKQTVDSLVREKGRPVGLLGA